MCRWMILLGILGAVPLLALSGCNMANTQAFEFDGRQRSFVLFVPEDLPPEPVPLVIMLHGTGSNGRSTALGLTGGRWNELAVQEQFVVVYPDAVDGVWNDCRTDADTDVEDVDDVGFISRLIDVVDLDLRIDNSRVYVAGHSNGGGMAFRLAQELSGEIAAVASNAGPRVINSNCTGPDSPVSIMYLAGTADPIVPFEGGTVRSPTGEDLGEVLSANDTVVLWGNVLQTDAEAQSAPLPNLVEEDQSTVTAILFDEGLEGSEVLFYRIENGGHQWSTPSPASEESQAVNGNKNRDFNTADAMWGFFRDKRL